MNYFRELSTAFDMNFLMVISSNINEFPGKNIYYQLVKVVLIDNKRFCFFFFYLVFLSRTFVNHRTAGEGGGHFLNSSLPLLPNSQTNRH